MVRLLTTRNLLTLAIIFIAAGLTVLALRNYHALGPEIALEPIPDNVDLALKNIKYTKTRDGEPLWILEADSAAHSMEDGITRIKNVRMVFFDQKMGDIVLTADQGELLPEYQAVKVRSNVKVMSPPGNTLQTDYLVYKEATNSLQTDKMVKISFDHFVVSGKGMQMDIAERTLLLLDNVKALLSGMDGL